MVDETSAIRRPGCSTRGSKCRTGAPPDNSDCQVFYYFHRETDWQIVVAWANSTLIVCFVLLAFACKDLDPFTIVSQESGLCRRSVTFLLVGYCRTWLEPGLSCLASGLAAAADIDRPDLLTGITCQLIYNS